MRIHHLLTSLLLLLVASSAQALSCGDLIFEDTVMTHDLIGCPASGLVIVEGDITVDLNGHVISGLGGGAGIEIQPGVTDVKILGPGKIEQFYIGVRADSTRRIEVRYLTLNSNSSRGVSFDDVEKSLVYANKVVASNFGVELSATSGLPADRNFIVSNEVSNCLGHGTAFLAEAGDDHGIEQNFVDGCAFGIRLSGTNRVNVEGNVVLQATETAIELDPALIGGMTENRVVGNKLYENQDGVRIASSHAAFPIKETLVQENSIDSAYSGLHVNDSLCIGTKLLDNHLTNTVVPIHDNGALTVISGNFCDGSPC